MYENVAERAWSFAHDSWFMGSAVEESWLQLFGSAGKLRTADCVAKGHVEVVVMSKRDFQDLDNPLLAWMIDYEAVTTVLKVTLWVSNLLSLRHHNAW